MTATSHGSERFAGSIPLPQYDIHSEHSQFVSYRAGLGSGKYGSSSGARTCPDRAGSLRLHGYYQALEVKYPERIADSTSTAN